MMYTNDMFDDLLSQATIENVQRCHTNLLKSGKQIVLYGAGTIAVSTINSMRADGLDVSYVCDSDVNKVGKTLLGVEIISIERLVEIKDSVNVIITTGAVNEVHKKLNHFAINHFAINHEIIDWREKLLNSVSEMRDGIKLIVPLLTDDESRGVFYNAMRHYMLLDYNYNWIEKHIRANQYFYQIALEKESFVDVGAFDGDTFRDFIDVCQNNYANYYGIEMDIDNFNSLKDKTKGFHDVELFNCAATSSDCMLSYKKTSDDKKSDFTLSQLGDTAVNGRSVDNLLSDKRVTFLKADIEGAELDMLKGAEKIISEQKPKCAICVYHNPEHFWKVPLYLHNLNPNYKFSFRMHQPLLFEVVCYAL